MLNSLLYEKSRRYSIFLVTTLIVIIVILTILFIKKQYDVIIFKGIVECNSKCNISINSTVDNAANLKESSKLIIDDKEYKYSIDNISELEYDYISMSNYQSILLDIDIGDKYKNNQVLDIYMYTNKERIIHKILKKVIGKE